MTAEVCIMNRLAVVLAADSATTVTRWDETTKREEQRYFKGANKVHQISKMHPVGLMIYDSASILRVPWEIVIKEFRTHLGDKSFSHLEGYADEFFSFLETLNRFFPEEVQKDAFISAARLMAFDVVLSPRTKNDSKTTDINTVVAERMREIDAQPWGPCLSKELFESIPSPWRDELKDYFKAIGNGDISLPDDMDLLATMAMMGVFKEPDRHLSTTGLVFAGFGDHDVFPKNIEYQSCGIVAGRHVHKQISKTAIDHETPAWISAFAQTSMSDTFTLGISIDVYSSVMAAAREVLPHFAAEIAKASGGDVANIADLKAMVDSANEQISDAVLGKSKREHALPLRRVLGFLAVDEMAELAETLINLQSLKEKVTKPSESVGGPIDVAVITRSEGLVWIKRKHFFDPNLNSRYMQRLAASYG